MAVNLTIMKARYEATIYILQKDCEPQIYYQEKFRWRWYAIIVCLLMQVDFTDLINAGVFDVQTKIDEI